MSLTKASFSMINGAYYNVLDYSAKDAKVQSVCALIHTPEVITAYKEAQNANINPTA